MTYSCNRIERLIWLNYKKTLGTIVIKRKLYIYSSFGVKAEEEEIFAIDRYKEFIEEKGKTISFIPFSEKVEGLTLTGFKYPLENYTLHQGDTICMSNIAIDDKAIISFKNGKILGIIIK